MPEAGLSAAEVGKEIAEHLERHNEPHDKRSRRLGIIEALLLGIVALLAAWSGFAAAQWSTESSLQLSQSTKHRTLSMEAQLESMESQNFDAETFDTWFTAWVMGDEAAMDLAERRFSDEFEVAFQAWLATDPMNNPDAPRGPRFMPDYEHPYEELADEEARLADEAFEEGRKASETADDYVRITVLLASVLFLIGISGHFRVHIARYGLVGVSLVILGYASALIVTAPRP